MKKLSMISLLVAFLLLAGSAMLVRGMLRTAAAQNSDPARSAANSIPLLPERELAAVPSLIDPAGGGGPDFWAGYPYQGYIEKSGEPYTGTCDLEFEFTGTDPHIQTFDDVEVEDGHFSVLLTDILYFEQTVFDFSVRAGCPSGGPLVSLGGMQSAAAVPYARSLLPNAVQYEPADGGCIMRGFNTLSDMSFALGCASEQISREELVPLEGDSGGSDPFISIGSESIESNQEVIGGLNARATYYGLKTEYVNHGFKIINSYAYGGLIRGANVGLSVGDTTLDAVTVTRSGADGVDIRSTVDNGVEVRSAGSIGVAVFGAVDRGFYTSDSGGSGLSIFDAGGNGVYAQGSGNYDGNFQGNIYIGGNCNGCTLANFAINAGETTLEPGTLVTIAGVADSEFREAPVLLQVRAAAAGEPVIGVVAGRAQVQIDRERRSSGDDDNITAARLAPDPNAPLTLVPREGPVGAGMYLTIVRDGLVQVHVDEASAATITAGSSLTVAAGRAVALDGAAESSERASGVPASIGIAMSAPDADGLVWTLFSVR